MAQNVLEVKQLATHFQTENGKVEAVKGLNFALEKGRTMGIVGESGSGKSVTALSIMRLINPPGKIAQGEVFFAGGEGQSTDLLKLSEKEMRQFRGNRISMIFQEPMTSLNPVISCGKQVAEALQLHLKMDKSQAHKRTIELFEQVELPRPEKIFKTYPHEISGGQKQRVMIAMAISCKPDILIADEPTTALDVTVQKSILSLIRNLQAEHGMSVIFITHDLGVVAEIADEVLVMFRGDAVEYGSVKQIFESPQHPYTRGLLACRPVMEKRFSRLPTLVEFLNEGETGQAAIPQVISVEDQRKRIVQLRQTPPVLEVKNLCKWYPVRNSFFSRTKEFIKAVDDVSFEVFPGETLGLVGESGSGKTTLGRSVLRLIEPTSGKVIFDGKVLQDLSSEQMREIRKDIQIIFQDPYSSLNPRIPIGKAIEEPMKVHGIGESTNSRQQIVNELLKKVGMEDHHASRYPHEFSGGQRQRICIARALAVEPKFIICDESVSALDVSIQAQVLNLLKQLQEEAGFTYIFVSHDLSVVKFMSDRILVLKDGKLVEAGNADELYANPQSPYTQALIDAVPLGTLEAIERAQAERENLRKHYAQK